KIGAKNIINSNNFIDKMNRALLTRKWKGAVDTVGGKILETILKSLDYRCSVASCGNALSSEINMTVYPFILRGVNLLRINSAETPMELRTLIWNKLANEWKPQKLNEIHQEISLEKLPEKISEILNGKIT